MSICLTWKKKMMGGILKKKTCGMFDNCDLSEPLKTGVLFTGNVRCWWEVCDLSSPSKRHRHPTSRSCLDLRHSGCHCQMVKFVSFPIYEIQCLLLRMNLFWAICFILLQIHSIRMEGFGVMYLRSAWDAIYKFRVCSYILHFPIEIPFWSSLSSS